MFTLWLIIVDSFSFYFPGNLRSTIYTRMDGEQPTQAQVEPQHPQQQQQPSQQQLLSESLTAIVRVSTNALQANLTNPEAYGPRAIESLHQIALGVLPLLARPEPPPRTSDTTTTALLHAIVRTVFPVPSATNCAYALVDPQYNALHKPDTLLFEFNLVISGHGRGLNQTYEVESVDTIFLPAHLQRFCLHTLFSKHNTRMFLVRYTVKKIEFYTDEI